MPSCAAGPPPGEWCVNEVMAHLLHVETEVFLPRLRRMAAEDRPAFVAFTPRGVGARA